MRQLIVRSLHICSYENIWQQMRLFTSDRSENTQDELWLLQHEPIFTLGQNAQKEHILQKSAIATITTDRGGQVTYHGPGQMMIYTLFNIKKLSMGVKQFVKELEQLVIDLLASYNVSAERRQSAPGVYINGAKICSIGLRVKRGCSYHGLALNINMDLQPFLSINPCGLADLAMTQLTEHVDNVSWRHIQLNLIKLIKERFHYEHIIQITQPWESVIHETAE